MPKLPMIGLTAAPDATLVDMSDAQAAGCAA